MTDDTDDGARTTTIRLPTALLDRLDAHTARMRAQNPGLTLSRSSALRTLLIDALDRAEAADAPASRRPTR